MRGFRSGAPTGALEPPYSNRGVPNTYSVPKPRQIKVFN
jgi:hypothetical protein